MSRPGGPRPNTEAGMPARSSVRTLLPLCLASLCWAFSFGAGAQLASLWLKDAGCSAFTIALGMALGIFLGMELYAIAPWLGFLQGGLLGMAAAVVVDGWLPPSAVPPEEPHDRTPLEFRRNFLSFGSAWSQGFLEGGMMALLALYLISTGLSEEAAGGLMGGIMVGVIVFQVPLAWLAD